MTSDPATIAAYATAIVAVTHALASATVQIVRAWKQPVTTTPLKDTTHLAVLRPGPAPITPTPPKGQ